MKYDVKRWLKVIHEYLDDGVLMTKLCKKYNADISKIKYRVKLYLLHGEAPFTDEQEYRVYTREEKLKALKIVLSGKSQDDKLH